MSMGEGVGGLMGDEVRVTVGAGEGGLTGATVGAEVQPHVKVIIFSKMYSSPS